MWLLCATLAAAVGAHLAASLPGGGLERSDEALAMVGLKTVREGPARAVYRRQQARALGEILTNRLVMQTASDKGVTFNSGRELVYPSYLREDEEFNAFGPRLWPIHAIQMLAEREWPESRLRQFHQIFEEELSLYEVRGMEVTGGADIDELKSDLSAGVDFDGLLSRYALDEDGLRHQIDGLFTRSELEELCGEQMANAVVGLEPGIPPRLMHRGPGYFVFQVLQSKTTFEQLKPDLRKRILKSRRLALIYQEFLTPGSTLTTDTPVEYDWAHWQ